MQVQEVDYKLVVMLDAKNISFILCCNAAKARYSLLKELNVPVCNASCIQL